MQDSTLTQAGNDLLEILKGEGSGETIRTAATSAASAPTLSRLFESGLCAGYPLRPSTGQYFVAQEFSDDREDLLRSLEEAFRGAGLRPYRADQDLLPGHLLCKIAAKIQTTLFSVFELTRTQNRNVYLELGVAVGLGRPFLLVKEADAEVSPLTRGLDYYNIRSYAGLRRELGSKLEEYFLNIARYRKRELPPPDSEAHVVVAHGNYDMPADFCLSVAEAVAPHNLKTVPLGDEPDEIVETLRTAGTNPGVLDEAGLTHLDATVRAIQAARFGVYHVDSGSSPDAFLALGVAIGLNRPWLLVSREGAQIPADVRGLSMLTFRDFGALSRRLSRQLDARLMSDAGRG
jgi:hypothetical protein